MYNIGNYFENFKKYFYRNKKDEYIMLLNLKDKIINIFKYDPYHDELISLLDLLLYEDKENEFIEFLINEIINYKIRCNNFNVMNYIITSGLILYEILNDIKKLKNKYYNEIYNGENEDENYFILY